MERKTFLQSCSSKTVPLRNPPDDAVPSFGRECSLLRNEAWASETGRYLLRYFATHLLRGTIRAGDAQGAHVTRGPRTCAPFTLSYALTFERRPEPSRSENSTWTSLRGNSSDIVSECRVWFSATQNTSGPSFGAFKVGAGEFSAFPAVFRWKTDRDRTMCAPDQNISPSSAVIGNNNRDVCPFLGLSYN